MTGMTTDAGDLRELTVGTGAGLVAGTGDQQLGTDMVLNIGPQHPSTHGVLRLKLVLDGERVIACEPIVGYMHRGRRSSSRYATTGRSSCWPTGTTGSRRSPTSWVWCSRWNG
ncbi:hypothetical protein GCM10027614_53090 [Micromonospora vulcania]